MKAARLHPVNPTRARKNWAREVCRPKCAHFRGRKLLECERDFELYAVDGKMFCKNYREKT